jgi:hypothetical protein
MTRLIDRWREVIEYADETGELPVIAGAVLILSVIGVLGYLVALL